MPATSRDDLKEPHIVKMFIGGLSGSITATMVHPLDVLKVRIQIKRREQNNLGMLRKIYQCEGIRGLYVGLSAAILRQATVTTTRFGVFNVMYTEYQSMYGKKPNLTEKVSIGITAGIASSFFAAPCDLALVRMLSESPRDFIFIDSDCYRTRPRRYGSVFNTLHRIAQEEGIKTLWKGASLTVTRSIILSIAQIGTYSEVDRFLKSHQMRSRKSQHVCSSIVASFVAAFFSLPVDTVKTRYLVRYKYNHSPKTIFMDIIQREGLWSLYKGFLPYYVRMLHATTFTIVVINYFSDCYHQLALPAR